MNTFDDKKMAEKRAKPTLSIWRILLLVIGGGLVGAVSGLFGGGGGTLLVPLMSSVGMLREKESHATSIIAILPLTIVSSIVYLAMGTRAEWNVSVLVVLGVFGGGLIGSMLLSKLKASHLKIIFYIIMIVAGVRMIV